MWFLNFEYKQHWNYLTFKTDFLKQANIFDDDLSVAAKNVCFTNYQLLGFLYHLTGNFFVFSLFVARENHHRQQLLIFNQIFFILIFFSFIASRDKAGGDE